MPKLTFNEWERKLDQYIQHLIGCSLHDLIDVPLQEWYDDNIPIQQAAQWTIELQQD